jgi:hypothetical protein
MQQDNQPLTMQSTLKSDDTEERLDIYFYRPLGYRFALFFRRVNITPNQVTTIGIIIGMIAGCFFYSGNLKINIVGMLLLMLANTCDSADGQLARMTNNKSRMGRILDGLSGTFWFTVITVALTLRLQDHGWSAWVWVLSVAAGLSHQLQSQQADYYRNVHLYFIKGRAGSEQDNSKALDAELAGISWSKNFWKRLVLGSYRNYTRQQEMLSPKLQLLLNEVRSRYNDQLPTWLVTEFRQMNKPLMKYTNIIQFNTRVIVLFICLFIDQVWVFFLFELIVLNAIMLYMIIQQEKISTHFYKEIKKREAVLQPQSA